jgi:AAA15 family ATPase/GTPase
MLTELNIQNFKSWENIEKMQLAPLTGLFGTNSSGKTGIIQLLLMLKQTVDSPDRQLVLNTGDDDKAYIDLGTIYDVIYKHQIPGKLGFSLTWDLPENLNIINPKGKLEDIIFSISSLSFSTDIKVTDESIAVNKMIYSFDYRNRNYQFTMQQKEEKDNEYNLLSNENYELKRFKGRVWPLPKPIKNYGFPDQISYFQNAAFLSDFVLALEGLFQNIYYLGPLRDYPKRIYPWNSRQPTGVGKKGELAIAALLASRSRDQEENIEERVGQWLRTLGLIYDFQLKPIGEKRQEYELLVRRTPNSSEVLITDVGFGVSQILPVLVLCYYAPKGSILIFEQPEIHLHPSVQENLADVFIDVIKNRNMQIIIESHSEHLLRRLQRRIAEKELQTNQAKLYFCELNEEGSSKLMQLELDSFGNINNWPPNFFGDEMGELLAIMEATMRRQQEGESA